MADAQAPNAMPAWVAERRAGNDRLQRGGLLVELPGHLFHPQPMARACGRVHGGNDAARFRRGFEHALACAQTRLSQLASYTVDSPTPTRELVCKDAYGAMLNGWTIVDNKVRCADRKRAQLA
jgi:hypothetical protein